MMGFLVLVGELEIFFNWQSALSRQIRHVLKSRGARARPNDAIIMRSKDAQCKCEE